MSAERDMKIAEAMRDACIGVVSDLGDTNGAPYALARIDLPAILATIPPEPVSVPEGYAQGIKAVAKMLEKKANDYADEFGYDDMGSLSFGSGMNATLKRDYHSCLIELTEEVRAMLAAPQPEQTAKMSASEFSAFAIGAGLTAQGKQPAQALTDDDIRDIAEAVIDKLSNGGDCSLNHVPVFEIEALCRAIEARLKGGA